MRLIPLRALLNFPKGTLFNRECPKCQGKMQIISFIEDQDVIKKISKHLGLWLPKRPPPPRANPPPQNLKPHLDYSDSQLPPSGNYLYVDEQYAEAFSA